MQTITIPQIEERLRELPTDKLAVVFDFVSYLAEQSMTELSKGWHASALWRHN